MRSICVDMHVHLGRSKDGARFTAGDIEKLLMRPPVTHVVVFPIDEIHPGPSYSSANLKVSALARRNKKILGFCRLNPRQKEASFKELESCVRRGARGVKLHPRSENFSPSEAEDLMEAIEKEKLPVVLHSSHEPHCHPASWESVFSRHKKTSFILAHAGKDAYLEAQAVASRCPNVYLDTSTLSYRRTEVLLKKAGPEKIVFASDLPYSHPALEWLKFDLILGKNSSARHRIFCENPKRILGGLP